MMTDRVIPAKTLRVAHTTETTKIGGSIAWSLREHGCIEITACGAGAVNQMVKGIAQARMYLGAEYKDIICRPRFTTVTVEGDGDEELERTAMVMECQMVDQE
jgi:stage V sporulation protein SpoVS